ncbi:MAG: metalloregulator ArsR/SmtB family transcription factor [Clostridia bacterium]|jgi:ArsR family transcriptional regulator|nr:metalloregulator ArsR/SmtB family transcription factor [Clostridia bacterium]MDD4275435.1 metalloregulator ArsR/SmtB family transcription factor [Clostridia bacterium]
MDCKEQAHLFKVLSDETRLKIVDLLKQRTLCACKILEKFNITQPTLSYHMNLLEDSGLVFKEKNGIWNNYTLNMKKLSELQNYFSKNIKCCDY